MKTVAAVTIVTTAIILAAAPAQAAASLRIVPSPTTQSANVTAFGSGFCGGSSCPSVRLVIDGRVVATTAVAADGSFRVAFKAPSLPNQYAVVAEQDGSSPRRATVGLLVLASTSPVTPPRASPSTTPPAKATTTEPTATSRPAPPGSSTTPPTSSAPSTSTSTAASDRTASAAPTQSSTDGGSPWPWILGAAAALAAGAALFAFVRRRHHASGA